MLGLAEYTVLAAELKQLGIRAQTDLSELLDPGMSRDKVTKLAVSHAATYYKDYKSLLKSGLNEIGLNALSYYSDQIGSEIGDPEKFVSDIVDRNYRTKYYGNTLSKKLDMNFLRFTRNINRSALWGKEYQGLHQLFVHSVPYGSQYNIDKRILLAMAVKVEQDVAKAVAKKEDLRLIRWTLSHAHAVPDICDDLSTNVDKGVVNYIEENNLQLNPKGVYFIEELPPPPHPNCRCEYLLVTGKERDRDTKVKRAFNKVKSLLSRLRNK